MVTSKKLSNPAKSPADPFRGINFTPAELASAKARMAQAEGIANGMHAAYKGVVYAIVAVGNGINTLARRVRGAFMKPAHR